jgi:hypothetical protein
MQLAKHDRESSLWVNAFFDVGTELCPSENVDEWLCHFYRTIEHTHRTNCTDVTPINPGFEIIGNIWLTLAFVSLKRQVVQQGRGLVLQQCSSSLHGRYYQGK